MEPLGERSFFLPNGSESKENMFMLRYVEKHGNKPAVHTDVHSRLVRAAGHMVHTTYGPASSGWGRGRFGRGRFASPLNSVAKRRDGIWPPRRFRLGTGCFAFARPQIARGVNAAALWRVASSPPFMLVLEEEPLERENAAPGEAARTAVRRIEGLIVVNEEDHVGCS